MNREEQELKAALSVLMRTADFLDDIATGQTYGDLENADAEVAIQEQAAIFRGLALEVQRIVKRMKKGWK